MTSSIRGLLHRFIAWVTPDRITPVHPPVTFFDSAGREIVVRPYQPDDFEGLAAMYEGFDPAQPAQGAPPIRDKAIRGWLTGLLRGENVITLEEDRPVGHVSFVPDGTGRHELAIFVHKDFQHDGIGTELMAAGLGYASQQGVGYVWLSVEAWKPDIQRFYTRAGFSVVNPLGTAHRMSRTL